MHIKLLLKKERPSIQMMSAVFRGIQTPSLELYPDCPLLYSTEGEAVLKLNSMSPASMTCLCKPIRIFVLLPIVISVEGHPEMMALSRHRLQSKSLIPAAVLLASPGRGYDVHARNAKFSAVNLGAVAKPSPFAHRVVYAAGQVSSQIVTIDPITAILSGGSHEVKVHATARSAGKSGDDFLMAIISFLILYF
jgi:hypothetical protein